MYREVEKPELYCINLDREPEKFKQIEKEFSSLFKINRVSAIDGKIHKMSGVQALFKTNSNLFAKIIDSDIKTPYVIIIEDDVYKCKDFDSLWPKIFTYINSNSNWDFISFDHFLNFERPGFTLFNELFYKIKKSRNTGFMIYNIEFLRTNLKYLSTCGCLDMTMKHNTKFRQLIPKTLLVKQHVDKISNTLNKRTDNYKNHHANTETILNNFRETEERKYKCANPSCNYLKHTNIENNGGTHCCRACKQNHKHGPLCLRRCLMI